MVVVVVGLLVSLTACGAHDGDQGPPGLAGMTGPAGVAGPAGPSGAGAVRWVDSVGNVLDHVTPELHYFDPSGFVWQVSVEHQVDGDTVEFRPSGQAGHAFAGANCTGEKFYEGALEPRLVVEMLDEPGVFRARTDTPTTFTQLTTGNFSRLVDGNCQVGGGAPILIHDTDTVVVTPPTFPTVVPPIHQEL